MLLFKCCAAHRHNKIICTAQAQQSRESDDAMQVLCSASAQQNHSHNTSTALQGKKVVLFKCCATHRHNKILLCDCYAHHNLLCTAFAQQKIEVGAEIPVVNVGKSSCATDVMAMMCYPLIRRVSSIEATEPPVTPFVSLPNPDATMCAFTASIQVWYQLRELFGRILKQSCFETEMVRIKCPATFSLRSII